MKRFGNRVGDGTTDAAADNGNLLQPLGLCRLAERTDKIMQTVALVEVVQSFGCSADDLINDGNRALFAVIVGNGERDSFARIVNTENDELTGKCFFCNKGSLDLHERNGRIQIFFSYDFVHIFTFFQD